MNVTRAKPEMLERALAAHAQGRFDEAADLCRTILAGGFEQFDIWHLFALIQAARGRDFEALEAYDRAVSLQPSDAMAHYNRAISLQALQRWSDALVSFDNALSIRPEFPEALNNRGNVLCELRKLPEALASYDAALALRPQHFGALNNRALVLQQLGRFEEAIATYNIVLAVKPNHAEAHRQRGSALAQLKRFDEAMASYDAALTLQPEDADVLSKRSIALLELKRPVDALASCDAALALRPRHFEALNNQGLALLALSRPEQALASFDAILTLRPADPAALNNRANALQQLNRFDEALASYDAVLSICPNTLEAWTNRGHSLQQLRRFDQALASYDAALSIRSDYAEAHFSGALCRLLTGDFQAGWEAYEWRWGAEQLRGSKRRFSEPMWDGRKNIADRTILIHAEQGHGDTIQFCRYVPMLADKGANVILEVQPALKRLLQGLAGARSVLGRGDPLPRFDLHCPLLSLPRAFATRLPTIPGPPCLSIPDELMKKWSLKLPGEDSIRVGIVWAGASGNSDNRNRSIGLNAMRALSSLPVQLVSLQNEVSDAERSVLAAHKIVHFGPELTDFLQTAALTSLMDLVISVDTAVAHLAATLHRETWLLLPFTPDWRWMLDRDDTPWYRSVRLFRQPAAGDWPSVIAAVRAKLEARSAGAPAPKRPIV